MARVTKPAVRDPWANAVSTSPDIAQSVYPDTGFPAPAGVPVVPTRGEVNFEFNRYDSGMAYLFQHGVADWDATEAGYAAFDVLRDATNGKLYQLIGTATLALAPSADPTNWYLFHRVPRPMTGETAANEIAAWYNKKGFRITGKDHYGFDAGRILDFHEDWMDGGSAQKTVTAVSTLWFGRWNYAIDNGGSTAPAVGVAANGPWQADLNTHPWGPLLGVQALGAGVNAVSIVETVKAITKMSGASLVFECDFSINGASGPQTNTFFGFGLGDGTIAANRAMGSVSASTAYGAWVQGSTGGAANWQVASKPNGGVAVATDSGVAIVKDVTHRWRCIIVGTSDSDDSAARVIHLIDGVVVGNQTTSLNNQMLSPFVRVFANQGEVCVLNLGPMRIQSRLELGDVLI